MHAHKIEEGGEMGRWGLGGVCGDVADIQMYICACIVMYMYLTIPF